MRDLQTGKMIPINLPEICAPRLELLRRFDKAAEKRCIYVSAPGGCGKTVSTLLWLQKSGYTPIWLGFDAYDNTPAAFYRFFCATLFVAIPQAESLSHMIKEPAFHDSPVEYTIDILSRFSFDKRKYALVLDDFYFITHEEILKSLIPIIKRLPLSVTVIMISRTELPHFFKPLAEDGQIAFVGSGELAFRSDEIRRFFSSYGRFITEEEAERALSLTDGWAIAVSALALGGHITASHRLEGSFLEEYIKTEIWDKFDADLRLFMLQTSIVDEFSLPLAERLTQVPDAAQILSMLCSGNLFISKHQDTGQYRYHHMFLAFLRREAEKEAAIGTDSLYQTAADYYFAAGKYFDALRYSVKTADKKGTAMALYRFWNSTGKSSAELARIAFICELPAAFLQENPYLYVGCAWYAMFCGNVRHFFAYMDQLYKRLPEIAGEYPLFLENALFLATMDHRYSFTQQRSMLPGGGALALDARNLSKSHCQHFPTYHRTHRDYSHYALNTAEHFEEFRLAFAAMLGDYYPIIESGVRAGLLYEQNQLKEALALATLNPVTDSDELIFLSRLHIASCLLAMGQEGDAARCREELRDFLEKNNLLYLLPVFSAYETKIKLFHGNKAAAAAWLDNYFVNDGQDMELHKIFLHLTTARAYIVLGEYKKAESLCKRLITLSRDFGRLLDRIEATVLLMIIQWTTGRQQEAAALLNATLTEAEPYGFVRVFADEGKAILPGLNRLRKKAGMEGESVPDAKYVHTVYQAAYDQSKRRQGIAGIPTKPVKLSKQQKYLLELLAKGYRNAEILEITGLSINTIRSHTKMIYQKLAVNTALDAVLRARELELID